MSNCEMYAHFGDEFIFNSVQHFRNHKIEWDGWREHVKRFINDWMKVNPANGTRKLTVSSLHFGEGFRWGRGEINTQAGDSWKSRRQDESRRKLKKGIITQNKFIFRFGYKITGWINHINVTHNARHDDEFMDRFVFLFRLRNVHHRIYAQLFDYT